MNWWKNPQGIEEKDYDNYKGESTNPLECFGKGGHMGKTIESEERIQCSCGALVRESEMIPISSDNSICPDCAGKYEAWADSRYDSWKEDQAEQDEREER